MSCASFRVMFLFLDRSLITNCYVYLCNSCYVVSYKAVTVVFFLNIEEIESKYTDWSKFNRPMQLRLIHGKQLSFWITSWIFSHADKSD